MIFRLALRNVFRHRGRFWLATFIIGIASLMLVFATGQIGGVRQALVRGMTDSLTGQIQIKPRTAPREFFDLPSSRKLDLIASAELSALLTRLRALDVVQAASPRLRFGALIGNDVRSTPAMIIGVDPSTEGAVTPDLGSTLGPLATPGAAMVSEYLTKKSGIGLGKEVLIFSETPDDSFNARPYTIAAFASSPVLIDEYMRQIVLVDLASANKLLGLAGDASEIVIRLKPGREADLAAAVAQINAALSPAQQSVLGVTTWKETATAANNIGNIAAGIGAIQVGAIMFVMLIIVLVITKMGLYERQAEIGTLMSLGMTRMRLLALFMTEVTIKVLIGYGIGFLIALFLLFGIRNNGGIKAVTEIDQYTNGGKIMIPVIDGGNILLGFLLVMATALLITVWSCWRAGSADCVTLLNQKK